MCRFSEIFAPAYLGKIKVCFLCMEYYNPAILKGLNVNSKHAIFALTLKGLNNC